MPRRLVCTCGHSAFRHGSSTTLGTLAKRLFGRTRREGCDSPGCPCKIANPTHAIAS